AGPCETCSQFSLHALPRNAAVYALVVRDWPRLSRLANNGDDSDRAVRARAGRADDWGRLRASRSLVKLPGRANGSRIEGVGAMIDATTTALPQFISMLLAPMFMVSGAASMNWGLQRLQSMLTARIHKLNDERAELQNETVPTAF